MIGMGVLSEADIMAKGADLGLGGENGHWYHFLKILFYSFLVKLAVLVLNICHFLMRFSFVQI